MDYIIVPCKKHTLKDVYDPVRDISADREFAHYVIRIMDAPPPAHYPHAVELSNGQWLLWGEYLSPLR